MKIVKEVYGIGVVQDVLPIFYVAFSEVISPNITLIGHNVSSKNGISSPLRKALIKPRAIKLKTFSTNSEDFGDQYDQ